MVPGRGQVLVDEPDLDELLSALQRMRAVDQTLQQLQARHELSLRGFLLANGPTLKLLKPIPEQNIAEPSA
jgi:hypothetical protein